MIWDGAVGSRSSFQGYGYPWANVSNVPFRWFKKWTHEGAISTPFIARYPGMIERGTEDLVLQPLIEHPGSLCCLIRKFMVKWPNYG